MAADGFVYIQLTLDIGCNQAIDKLSITNSDIGQAMTPRLQETLDQQAESDDPAAHRQSTWRIEVRATLVV
jgi:hypothetical protein